MTCARCLRRISKKDVEAHRYVYSKWTDSHYCLRPNCKTKAAA